MYQMCPLLRSGAGPAVECTSLRVFVICCTQERRVAVDTSSRVPRCRQGPMGGYSEGYVKKTFCRGPRWKRVRTCRLSNLQRSGSYEGGERCKGKEDGGSDSHLCVCVCQGVKLWLGKWGWIRMTCVPQLELFEGALYTFWNRLRLT